MLKKALLELSKQSAVGSPQSTVGSRQLAVGGRQHVADSEENTSEAQGVASLKVFGNDYSTRDGTCVRDYIHVIDPPR